MILLLATLSLAPWWSAYGDKQLDALVERALAANLDVKSAEARIRESRALAGESRSKLLPAINLTSNAGRLRGGFQQGVARIPTMPGAAQSGSFVAPFDTAIYQGSLDMRWELDFWGANRAGRDAALADTVSSTEMREDMALIVSAEVVRAYVELRGLGERIAITERSRDAQKELLDLTTSRADAGLSSQLDVERQRALLENTEASLPPLEAERSIRRHHLAVLLGDRTAPITIGDGALTAPALPAALDSELLKRRPDVRAAEVRINAAMLRLKQARTDLFPKIALSGLMGRQSTSLGGLSLGGGNFFNLAPQLQLPIFSGGRIRQQIAAQDARVEQARLEYQKEVLAAFEEAANALAGYQRQQERAQKLTAATESAARSLALSRELATAGLGDFLTVLDAQRTLLDAEFQKSAAATSALVESVTLHKALAGGWK
ncbi:MAG: efflux transporter outer membrane subunit [Bryobacteraceae bacterium]|nr:efflux transporter outer membrane subunit [Bryobacteraceae bacterium]